MRLLFGGKSWPAVPVEMIELDAATQARRNVTPSRPLCALRVGVRSYLGLGGGCLVRAMASLGLNPRGTCQHENMHFGPPTNQHFSFHPFPKKILLCRLTPALGDFLLGCVSMWGQQGCKQVCSLPGSQLSEGATPQSTARLGAPAQRPQVTPQRLPKSYKGSGTLHIEKEEAARCAQASNEQIGDARPRLARLFRWP